MRASLRLDVAWRTHPGLRRSRNEDTVRFIRWSPGGGRTAAAAFVLADGMGGQDAGDIASRVATDTVCHCLRAVSKDGVFDPDSWHEALTSGLRDAVAGANRAVRREATARDKLDGIGTTLVCLVLVQDWYVLAHVGDSRAYRLRGSILRQLTLDHSWLEYERSRGTIPEDELLESPLRAHLTRAVGLAEDVEPAIAWGQMESGDLFLLCSDGLTHYLDGTALGLAVAAGGRPARIARRLISTANELGGGDNVTVGIVRWRGMTGCPLPAPPVPTDPIHGGLAIGRSPRDHRVDLTSLDARRRRVRRLGLLTAGLAIAVTTVVVAASFWL